MATHFVCQSTEPLPHIYPTGLAQKSHGAVSQYEVYNSSNKAHTRFPPPGWDFSQSSEEDSLPLLQPAPQPEWRNTSLHPDPDLCITPQKPQAVKSVVLKNGVVAHQKNQFEPDPLLTLTPEKSYIEKEKSYDKSNYIADKGKKVRFDIEDGSEKQHAADKVTLSDKDGSFLTNCNTSLSKKMSPDKQYKPGLYGDNIENKEENVEKEQGGYPRTVKYTVGKVGDQPVYVDLTKDNMPCESTAEKTDKLAPTSKVQNSAGAPKDTRSLPVKIIREKSASRPDSDPIAACKVPEESGPKRKVKVLRENQYMPKETEYNYPFSQRIDDFGGGEEHMFTRPEYNSTLRLKKEAEKLKQAQIDVESALKKQLTLSESTKTDINEKASSHVNTQGSLFSGLVSLDLPADQICQQAAEMKTARARVTVPARQKSKDQREPDLLEFFTSDRQRESVSYSLSGVPAPSEQLSLAPNWRAFDLYRHNRVWEGRGSNRK